MSWNTKPLEDLLVPSGKQRAGNQDLPVLSITMKHGLVDQAEKFKKRVASNDTSKYRVAFKNELVVGFPIDEGVLGFQVKYKAGIVSPAYDIWKLKDETETHIPYLERYLRSPQARSLYASRMQGAVARRRSLTKTDFLNLEIPFPPLNDQIRIAHLLGKVEGLIAQRKQHLQQLDDLLKSVFLEMFSPSSDGYDDWPLVEIKDLAEKHKGAMRTGPFGSNLLHSEFTEDGDVAVLGIDNAVQNRFAWGERRYITQEKYQELQNYRIFPGDVIVTIMGTIGRSAVIPSDIPLAINTKHLAAITLNKNIANPIFVSYSIHSSPFILNQFKSKNRGAIMSGLNLGLIKETKIKRPPIELQNYFATIHERIDEVKIRYQKSLADLESLYSALSQQAFKGELDLSQVPLMDSATNVQNDGEAINEADAINPELEENSEAFNAQTQMKAEQLSLNDIDAYAMSNPQRREALLVEIFEQFLNDQSPDIGFNLDDFWQLAHLKSLDYMDEDSIPFGQQEQDYESIKSWVFSALNSGRLQQDRNQTYCLVETKETIYGNQIELKAGIKP